MAARYWVGGTGTWNNSTTTNWSATSGGVGGASLPVTTDAVYLDANSGGGTVTLTGNAATGVLSLDLTGFTGTITGTAYIAGAGGLTLFSGANATGLTVQIKPSGTTSQVTSNGQTFSGLTINGGTSAVTTLNDALSLTSNLTVTFGGLNTNGMSVTCLSMSSSGSGTRAITLGASTVTLTGSAGWNLAVTSNLTLNAGTSNIVLQAVGAAFNSGVVGPYYDVTFQGGAGQQSITSALNCRNLSYTNNVTTRIALLNLGGDVACSGTFTFTGLSGQYRVGLVSTSRTTQRVVSSASFSFANADLQYIVLAQIPAWTLGGTGGNLLTPNQSSLETDTAGWYTTSNCTIARTTAASSDGAASLAINTTSTASAIAATAASVGGYATSVSVVGGAPYVASAAVRSASIARTMTVQIRWILDGGATELTAGPIGGLTNSVTSSTTGWQTISTVGIAPQNATGAIVRIVVVSPTAGEVHYADQIGAWAGTVDLSAIPGGSGDATGNSGVIFTPATTHYKRSGGTTWSTTNNWASTSGGASNGLSPLPQDTAIFDANSNTTPTFDSPRLARNIIFTGFTGTANFNSNYNTVMYGDLTLCAGMTVSATTGVLVLSGRGSQTITTAGVSINVPLDVTTNGGTYTLADALTTTQSITVNQGTLDTANNTVTAATVDSSTATFVRSLMLGTSTVNLTGTGSIWTVNGTNLTASFASSKIVSTSTSSSSRNFTGSGLTYGTLEYTVPGATGVLAISSTAGNTFTTLNVGSGRTVTFQAGSTTTITNFNVFGASGSNATVKSATAGSPATISKASGLVAGDYLTVQDITGAGGATFYMGSRSTNVSGNTNLSFTDAPQRYWVGGAGTWDGTTTTNWAVVSGGAGGLSVPGSTTDVFLDANSGAGTVTLAATGAAKTLTFTGYTGSVAGAFSVNCYGNVTLASTMSGNLTWGLNFGLTSGTATLTSAGKTITAVNVLNSAGVATALGDALALSGALTLTAGTFTTNNFPVAAQTFTSSVSTARTVNLGSSTITLSGTTSTAWSALTSTNLTMNTGTSLIRFTGASAGMQSGGTGITYYDIEFTGANTHLLGQNTSCRNLTMTGTANKTDGLQIVSGQQVNATGTVTVNGNSTVNRVLVSGSLLGTTAAINAANVSFSNADFRDIAAGGAANWDLSAITGGSGDALGNTGITFTPAVMQYMSGSGTRSWSTASVWGLTAGTPGTGRVPLPQDNAQVSSTGSGTVSADMPRLGRDVSFTAGTTGTSVSLALSSADVHGNLIFNANTTAYGASGTNAYVMRGRGTHTFTPLGFLHTNGYNIGGIGGTYNLGAALSNTSAQSFSVSAGTFNTNGYNISTGTFGSSGTTYLRTVNLGTSTISVSTTSNTSTVFFMATTNLTLDATAATVNVTGTSGTRFFGGAGFTYGTLNYTSGGTGSLTITGDNTFGSLNTAPGTSATLLLTAGSTQTVTSVSINGNATTRMPIRTSAAGSTATLVKAGGGVVNADYLTIQDLIAMPASTWYAGSNSTDAGNNTGWLFTAASALSTAGQPKVYIGGAWVRKPAKVYIGGQWVVKPMKRWNGSAWVAI